MLYHIETASLSLSHRKKMNPYSSLFPKGIVAACIELYDYL